MNHRLELNSRRLNQSFVLEKANPLILWNFPRVSENPESGPMPGCKGSGGNHLLSLLLCSCLAISFHLVKRRFTQSASPRVLHRQGTLPHPPSQPGRPWIFPWFPTEPANRWRHIMSYPLFIYLFIHSLNKHYWVTSMYQPLYLRRSHQGKWSYQKYTYYGLF